MSAHVFLIAGEPSGDRLGASLMAGLKRLEPGIEFSGVGGPLMQAEGMTSLFPMAELAVMGIAEVLPRLPKLLNRMRQAAGAVVAAAPDALVTIDSPDFCLRVAARVKAARPGQKIIHYVAPTVWAWRPERAVKMARHIDHVLALFPFEPPYMEAAGMTCDFVGHPVVADPQPDQAACRKFRAGLGVAPDLPLMLVLPGSRMGEITRMEPIFSNVVGRIAALHPDMQFVVVATGNVADSLTSRIRSWPVAPTLLDPRRMSAVEFQSRKSLAFAAADIALAASGTVSLELAAADTPMVIAHKFNWLTTRIVKKKVNLRSATLVNILTGTDAIPEFLFEDCNADNIATHIQLVLASKVEHERQLKGTRAAMKLLGRGAEAPGLRAARSVLRLIQ